MYGMNIPLRDIDYLNIMISKGESIDEIKASHLFRNLCSLKIYE